MQVEYKPSKQWTVASVLHENLVNAEWLIRGYDLAIEYHNNNDGAIAPNTLQQNIF